MKLGQIFSRLILGQGATQLNEWHKQFYSLFDRAAVNKVSAKCAPEYFIENLAHEIGVSPATIRNTVSYGFKIPIASEIYYPGEEFLNSFAAGYATFAEFVAIPQPQSLTYHGSYRLVVSNPAIVSLRAFKERNIEVCLGDRADISNVLSQWKGRSDNIAERIDDFLTDLFNLGCRRLILTELNDGPTYRFTAVNGEMGGKLSSSFYSQFKERCQTESWMFHDDGRSTIVAKSEFTDSGTLIVDLLTEDAVDDIPELSTITRSKEVKDILLVEDNVHFGEVLTSIFEAKGYSVWHVRSFQECKDAILDPRFEFKLLISDYHLGEYNGKDVIRLCSKNVDPLPILFLTEDENPATQVALIELGSQAFIRKSENPMILLAWVVRLLNPAPVEKGDKVVEAGIEM